MAILRKMTADEFETYLAAVMPAYAAEGARSIGISLEEGLERARTQLAKLLPEGARTPGHDFWIVEKPPGARVGILWAATQGEGADRHLFVYDVVIDEEARGRGYGTAAMRAVEDEARAGGIGRIVLHVFEHNEGAIRLYERLGYRTLLRGHGGRRMARELGVGVEDTDRENP